MRLEQLLRWCTVALLALLVGACASGSGGSRPGDRPQAQQSGGPMSPAEVQVRLGREYMAQGNLQLAQSRLLRALELDPRLPSAHTVIAVLYERIGNFERAGFHFRRAAELAPQLGDTQNNYGAFLCRAGDFVRADSYFVKALEDPFYGTPEVPLTSAGLCAMEAGNAEQAEAYLRRALSVDAASRVALITLAAIVHERGDHFRARAFVQRYESAGEDTAEGLYLAGLVERALGNDATADDYQTRLMRQFPDSLEAGLLRESRE